MGHINAQHKPLCHILKKSLFRKVKSFIDTVQGIMKDKGIGPLLSRAPYLFVVKKTDEATPSSALPFTMPSRHALQLVRLSRRGDDTKSSCNPKVQPSSVRVSRKIKGKNILFTASELFCKELFKERALFFVFPDKAARGRISFCLFHL